jgi:hypothetical protein
MNTARHDVGAAGSDLTFVGGRFHALLARHNVEGFGSRMRVDTGLHSRRKDRFREMGDRRTDRQCQGADDCSLDATGCWLRRLTQYVEPVSGMCLRDGGPSVVGSLRISGCQVGYSRMCQ